MKEYLNCGCFFCQQLLILEQRAKVPATRCSAFQGTQIMYRIRRNKRTVRSKSYKKNLKKKSYIFWKK